MITDCAQLSARSSYIWKACPHSKKFAQRSLFSCDSKNLLHFCLTRFMHWRSCTFFDSAQTSKINITFRTVNYPYSTRNVHDLSFCNLHGHTLQYLHSYFPDTIKLWNTLPYNIVSCKSLGAFKHALYAHFKYNVN